MAFQPIKTKKIYEEIMEQIKSLLTRGDLHPGDRLPAERDLAESLGVSRASVREALTALATMGILDIRPGEGTFVKQTSGAETFAPLSLLLALERNSEADLMEVRRILETECAALAASRASREELKKIESSLEVMKKSSSIQEAVEADVRFHFSIAEATHNSVLLRIMNTIGDLMHNNSRQTRENIYADPLQGPLVLVEHEAILKAIKGRNPAVARQRMLEHIENIEARLNSASLP